MASILGPAQKPITGPLEKHFPVSSGNDHRKFENGNRTDTETPVYKELAQPEEVFKLFDCIKTPNFQRMILYVEFLHSD